jgi:hypothetical protein
MQVGNQSRVAIAVTTGSGQTSPATTSSLLSVLSVTVLVVGLSADVALRLLPPGWFAFRAWEVAGLYPTAEGPFTPNLVYQRSRAWGDLANLGNFPNLRQFRTEIFTTDAFGYRNTGGLTAQPIRGILVGDSYAVGTGVSDQETLPGQLEKLIGLNVYNGSGRPNDWPSLQRLIDRLNLRGGLVIWEESELWPIPDHVASPPQSSPSSGAAKLIPPTLRQLYKRFQTTHLLLNNWLQFSPGQIVLSRLFRTIQDDKFLPNARSKSVAIRTLRNGQTMLFLRGSVDTYPNPHPIPVSFFAELNSLVKASGNELLVVLVPDKYTVYAPLLDVPPATADSELYLNRLQQRLDSDGVSVVNLTDTLRAQAAEGILRAEYNYWIDDTHWSTEGLRKAAQAITAYSHHFANRSSQLANGGQAN